MAKLDLFTSRTNHELKIEWKGEPKIFELPTDLTVGELERILEIEQKYNQDNNEDKSYFSMLSEQLYLIFKRCQPDMSFEEFKDNITRDQVMTIFGFISKNILSPNKSDVSEDDDDGKKKEKLIS
jgi:hypothetical protein